MSDGSLKNYLNSENPRLLLDSDKGALSPSAQRRVVSLSCTRMSVQCPHPSLGSPCVVSRCGALVVLLSGVRVYALHTKEHVLCEHSQFQQSSRLTINRDSLSQVMKHVEVCLLYQKRQRKRVGSGCVELLEAKFAYEWTQLEIGLVLCLS